jgi:hypothetical protein
MGHVYSLWVEETILLHTGINVNITRFCYKRCIHGVFLGFSPYRAYMKENKLKYDDYFHHLLEKWIRFAPWQFTFHRLAGFFFFQS